MRNELMTIAASAPTAVPEELIATDALGRRLLRLAETLGEATGGREVTVYRCLDGRQIRLLGPGPNTLDWVAHDCTQAGSAEVAPAEFATFATLTCIESEGEVQGMLAVGHLSSRADLSGAQGYLVAAFAEQAGAVFELDRARHRVERALPSPDRLDRLRLFESIAVHARDSIVITEAEPVDMPGPRILYCNKAFTETTGYELDEVIGRTPRLLQGPRTDPAVRAKLRDAFKHWRPIEVELVNYKKDGTEFWVELSIVPVADDTGFYTHWLSVQRDVTERKLADELSTRIRIAEVRNEVLADEIAERKRVETELLFNAFHDSLTGLRNRAFFMERLKDLLATDDRQCAVLFLDLDRFKIVNDSLGHQAGDALLKEVSRRLRTCARAQDTLARFGGDEFALLIDGCDDTATAVTVASRMIEAMRAPVRIGRQEVFASCSIGIVHSSSGKRHPEALIRDADVAMYVSKRAGSGTFAVFDEAMNAGAMATLTLQTDLQQAVERREFEVAYQPIVEPQHGRIRGFEALIRWRHPERGLLQPGEFINAAEEMGLIRQIDRWVMKEACDRLAEWRSAFPEADLCLAVNTSASEFDDACFVEDLFGTLERLALPPHALELEITESIFLNPDPRIAEVIAQIRRRGVRIGLDDFGTGYSSLSYLSRYLTDTIKIDQSFTRSLCSDDRTLAIVLLIIQLAKTLHVDVIAEGVETEEQAELLASMSCSLAQGYHFARPMAAKQVTELLARSFYVEPGRL